VRPGSLKASWARPLKSGWAQVSKAFTRRQISEETGNEEKLEERLSELEEEAAAEAAEEAAAKLTAVVGILALAATFTIGFILEANHVHWMPEAGVGIIVGFVVASAASFVGDVQMLDNERFDFEFFMTWLLPPIIFEAGFNMNVGVFFKNIGPTMFFAFVGTFLSTFVVGGLVYQAGQMGLCYPLGLLASLVFGSLISATDPVTVLAVFQALGVKVDLFSMVFGESVLNDAVAIVLSRTLLGFITTPMSGASVVAACVTFCKIFVGSTVIGGFFGVFSAFLFKHLDLKHHHDIVFLECALSFPFPWAAYYMAEALQLSGIVAILFCGIVMATYTRCNFSEESVTLTAGAYKCIALVAETFVFIYLGMALVTFPIFDHTVWMLTFWAILACFVGRLHIFVGSWLANCFRGPNSELKPISGPYAFIMWFSGLRGGVAFALASLSFGPPSDFAQTKPGYAGVNDSTAILQVTMLIATFTIFVFGGSITSVCRYYEVLEPKGSKQSEEPSDEKEVNQAHNWLLELLTFEKQYVVEDTPRYAASLDNLPEQQEEALLSNMDKPMPSNPRLMSTSDFKSHIKTAGLEMSVTGVSFKEVSQADKMDQLRVALPGLSSDQIKKLLDASGGNVQTAISKAKSIGSSIKDMV
jgi:sodium/hydrogen exchanger 8